MKNILLLILLFFIIGCSDENKTDGDLLERDKQELEASLNSYKVFTYKFGKILIRAAASPPKDTTSIKFQADLDRISKKFVKYNLDSTQSLSMIDYISIYRDYKKMKAFIIETDEDIFPTLSDALMIIQADSVNRNNNIKRLTGKEKEFVQNIEHSILSAIVILSKDLGKEVSLYECSKTNPELLPDSEIKILLQFYRGFLFFEKGLYYLSEEEMTRNIAWLNKNKNLDFPYTRALFKWNNLSNQKTFLGLHSLNHLFRGFDRLMMDREIDQERALEDFEIFLKDSKEIGLDNEIIWAIETYLYLNNEKSEKAIVSLTKLKSSNLLFRNDKKRIDESIEYLKTREPGKVLNGVYDKYFLSKIATKYILHILSKVDWQSIMEEQNVPHTEEMFKMIENFKTFTKNLNKYTSAEQLKETGKDLKNKGKNLWNKAIELMEE